MFDTNTNDSEDSQDSRSYFLEDALKRVKENDSTLKYINLGYQRSGEQNVTALMDAFKGNQSVTHLFLSEKIITPDCIHSLAHILYENKTLTNLDLSQTQITHGDIQLLSNCLSMNKTLLYLDLNQNLIGDSGAQLLAKCLVKNMTLNWLFLAGTTIGDEGVKALSKSLLINKNLTWLNLNGNPISNSGATALGRLLYMNPKLEILFLENTQIDYDGELLLLNAVRHNSTIIEIYLNYESHGLQREFNEITHWNMETQWSSKDVTFPWNYRDYLIYILMILNETPLCSDLNWMIVTLLRVKDVVGHSLNSHADEFHTMQLCSSCLFNYSLRKI